MQLYSLKRLVRGLGSGRQAARQGFALSLTLLLSSIPTITSQGLLDLIDHHLAASKSKKVSLFLLTSRGQKATSIPSTKH